MGEQDRMTDSLRQLAQEATPGPWTASNRSPNKGREWCVQGGEREFFVAETLDNGGLDHMGHPGRANAAYIAAANPAVILRLLDAVDKARTLLDAPRCGDVAGEDPGYSFWAAFDDLRASLAALEGMTP